MNSEVEVDKRQPTHTTNEVKPNQVSQTGDPPLVQESKDYNKPEEVDLLMTMTGVRKAHFSMDKTLYLGFLAGTFIDWRIFVK